MEEGGIARKHGAARAGRHDLDQERARQSDHVALARVATFLPVDSSSTQAQRLSTRATGSPDQPLS